MYVYFIILSREFYKKIVQSLNQKEDYIICLSFAFDKLLNNKTLYYLIIMSTGPGASIIFHIKFLKIHYTIN